MTDFDKKHHEFQNAVNRVIYHAPRRKFTIDELISMLEKELPADATNGDIFYATELLKGTVCRLVLNNSIKKIDDVYYIIEES